MTQPRSGTTTARGVNARETTPPLDWIRTKAPGSREARPRLYVLCRTRSYAATQNRRTVTPMKTNRTPAPPGAQEPETLEGNLRLWDELNKLEDPELWDRIAELAAEAGN